jgi:molecular chaperone HscA
VAVSRAQNAEIIGDILPSIVEVNGQEIHSIKRKMSNPSQLVAGKTPVEISAEILKVLRAKAEAALGREVTKAVITVPAYFDDTARNATKDAAQIAGLEVLRLINEPTAAALAYGLDKAAEGIYAIYDLGGGTFDISILRMQKGVFQVLSTGGDVALGGDDFDREIEKLRNWEIGKGRKIKEQLTNNNEVEGVSRLEFEAAILPLVERTISICARAISDAELQISDIKGVVLVGGSTRVPLVQAKVAEFFKQAPLTDIDPDKVVALGAAIQAESLTKGSDNLLLDVTPLSLGLETMHGIVEKIIYRNTPIPCVAAQEFTTFENNQTGLLVHVLQGERENVADCLSLARFELRGIPPLPAGVARIKITFNIDADGLLTVSAREEKTGIEQTIEVKPSYGLQREDVMRMVLESLEHGQEDMQARLLAESKTEGERLLNSLREHQLNAELSDLVNQLETALKNDDRNQIENLRELLNEQSEVLAQEIMDSAIRGALRGKNVENI